MKILRGHKSAFARQVHEAVAIQRCQGKNLLNSKAEYNRCLLPRLGIIMGEKEEGSGDRPDGEHEILEIDEEKCIVSRKYSKRKENQEDTQPRLKRRKRWQTEVAAKRSRNKLGLSVENCSKRRKKMEEEPYANKIGSFPNHINEKTVNVEATKNGPKFCKIKSDKFSAKANNNSNLKDIFTIFK